MLLNGGTLPTCHYCGCRHPAHTGKHASPNALLCSTGKEQKLLYKCSTRLFSSQATFKKLLKDPVKSKETINQSLGLGSIHVETTAAALPSNDEFTLAAAFLQKHLNEIM